MKVNRENWKLKETLQVFCRFLRPFCGTYCLEAVKSGKTEKKQDKGVKKYAEGVPEGDDRAADQGEPPL